MKRLLIVFLITTLIACGQIGIQPSRNFEDNLAYSYSSVTAIRMSAADALSAGAMSVADAEKVLELSDQARVILDAAKAAHLAGDTAADMVRLAQVTTLLVQMQTYVKGRSK